jgi:hypothetical protein
MIIHLPISALYEWRAYSCRCLVPFSSLRLGCLAREFALLLSVPLVLEYEAVLKREEH